MSSPAKACFQGVADGDRAWAYAWAAFAASHHGADDDQQAPISRPPHVRVVKLTRDHGIVLQGEVVCHRAARAELGAQATVFKGTVIFAKFLASGAIFAPAFGFNDSFGPDGNPVRSFVADFYYVPKLK